MYKRYLIAAFAAGLVFFISFPAACAEGAGPENISALASNLGPDNFKSSFEIMKSSPSASVHALIGELRVVEATLITGSFRDQDRKDMHVIWCIRMLRALTGLDFTARTLNIFGPDEQQRAFWLTKKDNQGIPFFATVMSSDSVYIAPMDTQSDIIWEWSDWYKSYSSRHRYNTELPPKEDWYN